MVSIPEEGKKNELCVMGASFRILRRTRYTISSSQRQLRKLERLDSFKQHSSSHNPALLIPLSLDYPNTERTIPEKVLLKRQLGIAVS